MISMFSKRPALPATGVAPAESDHESGTLNPTSGTLSRAPLTVKSRGPFAPCGKGWTKRPMMTTLRKRMNVRGTF